MYMCVYICVYILCIYKLYIIILVPIINWIFVVLRNMAKFNVPPVFLKSKDVPDYMTLHEYDVYSCAKDWIGVQNVIGCQRIGVLWRIYVSSEEDRIKLITKRLTIRNQLPKIFLEIVTLAIPKL